MIGWKRREGKEGRRREGKVREEEKTRVGKKWERKARRGGVNGEVEGAVGSPFVCGVLLLVNETNTQSLPTENY